MQSKLVLREGAAEGIVKLTLNDPESRNAMSEAMGREFQQMVAGLRADPAVRVVILTGSGQAFSGGGHLDMLFEKTKLTPEENREQMQLFYRQFLSVLELEVPVIAAINGHAVGAGLCLALACDMRIAVAEAKLGLNFVHLGLHPGMGATYFLPRLVGPARTAELLYAGKVITAAKAEAIGLINAAEPADRFQAAVTETASAIAAAGPQANRELKQTLKNSMLLPLEECLLREAACQALDYAGKEFLEGISAAREKRKAAFQ